MPRGKKKANIEEQNIELVKVETNNSTEVIDSQLILDHLKNIEDQETTNTLDEKVSKEEVFQDNTIVLEKDVFELNNDKIVESIENQFQKQNITDNDKKDEVLNSNSPSELSPMAKKWSDYIKYLGMTPESFKEKYPTNKFLDFVDEVIEFNKNTEKLNI